MFNLSGFRAGAHSERLMTSCSDFSFTAAKTNRSQTPLNRKLLDFLVTQLTNRPHNNQHLVAISSSSRSKKWNQEFSSSYRREKQLNVGQIEEQFTWEQKTFHRTCFSLPSSSHSHSLQLHFLVRIFVSFWVLFTRSSYASMQRVERVENRNELWAESQRTRRAREQCRTLSRCVMKQRSMRCLLE